MHLEAAPFELGKTWYDGRTIDTNNLGGLELEGQERWFKDIDLTNTATVDPERTPFLKRCRIARNASGVTVLAKRLVTWQNTANYGKRFIGLARVTNEHVAGVVDEFLNSNGCPANDLCWLTVEGPTLVTTDAGATERNVISIGDLVSAITAHTTQSTNTSTVGTGGRAGLVAGTTATSTVSGREVFDAAANAVGRALSARTTDNTAADLLIYKNGGRL